MSGSLSSARKRHWWGVLLLAAAAGAAAVGCGGRSHEVVTATEIPAQHENTSRPWGRSGVWHVVQDGQTLWRISRAYRVDVETLARNNGIVDVDALEAGQSLFIPGGVAVLDVPPYPAPLSGDPRPPAVRDEQSLLDWPVRGGHVLSGYGVPRRNHRHKGIDIAGRPGQPVHAAGSGRVIYSGSTLSGYGKTIIIDHGDDLQSLYAHNSDLLAREGQRVERGQVIAHVGRTGNASTEHCHFEVRRKDAPVDPGRYLRPDAEIAR